MNYPRLWFVAGFLSGAIVASQAPIYGPYVAAAAGLIPVVAAGLIELLLAWLEERS